MRISGLEQIAIATTFAISTEATHEYNNINGQKVVYLNTDEIERQTGIKRIALYNDAEAAAFALNTPSSVADTIIQAGDVSKEPRKKTMVYVGTGFQLIRLHYDSVGKMYKPELGGGLMASLPISLLEIVDDIFLGKVAMEAGIESISKLRHTHILGARGLHNIHAAITGEEKSAAEIIDHAAKYDKTFACYSALLGKTLQNFASNDGFSQALYVGGTFAPVLAPHLNLDLIRKAFAAPDFLNAPYERIPIMIVNEPYPGNKGAAFAFRSGIGTTANLY